MAEPRSSFALLRTVCLRCVHFPKSHSIYYFFGALLPVSASFNVISLVFACLKKIINLKRTKKRKRTHTHILHSESHVHRHRVPFIKDCIHAYVTCSIICLPTICAFHRSNVIACIRSQCFSCSHSRRSSFCAHSRRYCCGQAFKIYRFYTPVSLADCFAIESRCFILRFICSYSVRCDRLNCFCQHLRPIFLSSSHSYRANLAGTWQR